MKENVDDKMVGVRASTSMSKFGLLEFHQELM